jgi:hypothetical protein
MGHVRPLATAIAASGIVAAAVWLVPFPSAIGWLQLPLGVIVMVCAIGKALFDTFFYDRNWR